MLRQRMISIDRIPSSVRTRIAVLGAGAVGLAVAAMLSKVAEVHAVSRNRHAKAVTEQGMRLSGIWDKGTFSFSCSESLPEAEFDFYVLTSKSNDTRAICAQFEERLRGREVVSLQNGIGNEEIIAEFTDRVIGGRIITGFEWRGDASVCVTVEAAPIRLGRFPSGSDDAVRGLVDLFVRAGMRAEVTDEVRTDLWGKALYNCVLNPLGAIMGVPYGALTHESSWRVIDGIAREVYAVSRVEGVQMPWPSADEFLKHLRDEQLPATAAHRSSMLQDIEMGRRTEIAFLNGAIVERGKAHGVATPLNGMMTDLILFKESLSAERS
jgi:2-dehydropantoate 2-reductase